MGIKKKKKWAGNMLLSTRCRIIILLFGENVMVSWSHLVQDKCRLIDKVISVLPRGSESPALGRNVHPSEPSRTHVFATMPTSEIAMIAWKWRSHRLKLPAAVPPAKDVRKVVRNHESWKHGWCSGWTQDRTEGQLGVSDHWLSPASQEKTRH